MAAPIHLTTEGYTMTDFAMPNDKPGVCCKCRGTGEYRWGTFTNGKASNSGKCFSCRGTGKQDRRQIMRNETYNRFKVVSI